MATPTVDAAGVAVMVVGPGATEVIGTLTDVPFGGNATLPGTVATLGLLEASVTDRPLAGAGADSVSATFWVVTPVMVIDGEAKVMFAVTRTLVLALENPGAEAFTATTP